MSFFVMLCCDVVLCDVVLFVFFVMLCCDVVLCDVVLFVVLCDVVL